LTGRLEHRIALVTGGARGIGRAIALAFARDGAAGVLVNYLANAEAANQTVDELRDLGCEALAVQADVADADQVRRMVDTAAERFGRLDILVNNAGLLQHAPFAELAESSWDRVLDVNLKGPFLCAQAALGLLRQARSPSIINMASGGVGMHGRGPGLAHYYAAKGGVITLTRCLAGELAPTIRVNCLAPGFTDTRPERTTSATRETVLSSTPLGRIGVPEDVAGAAVFLASEESSFITGQVFVIDGGRAM
jgi:3-oxoacyl-[acyl-carrier protein] reductase